MLQALTHPSPLVSSIISAMITPAILILATGNLIATSMTLHARIVDRIRYLIRRRIELREANSELVALATELIVTAQHRLRAIGASLSSYYIATGCFVAASLAIAVTNEFPWLPRALPTFLTVVGAFFLLIGSLITLYDTRLSSGLARKEVDRDFA